MSVAGRHGGRDLRERDREFWIATVGRPLVLMAWLFFLWGTFMFLALGHNVLSAGWAVTAQRLTRDAWGLVNLGLAVAAGTIWALVGVTWARGFVKKGDS